MYSDVTALKVICSDGKNAPFPSELAAVQDGRPLRLDANSL